MNAGQRVLPIDELTRCVAALDIRPTDIALKVALLSGRQRIQQLLKSTPADWDQDSATLLLYDGKPKVISQMYIDSPEKVAGLLGGKEADVLSLKVEEFGSLARKPDRPGY